MDPTLEPINRQAANLFKGGHQRNPSAYKGAHWVVCPKIDQRRRAKDNLAGLKFGRFIVIGLSSSHKSRWVVKCACGDYEVRKAKAVKNASNGKDMCAHCSKLIQARRHEEFQRMGYNPA